MERLRRPKLKNGTRCAICGKKLKPETFVYSRHTNLWFCIDMDACAKRAKRRAAKAVQK